MAQKTPGTQGEGADAELIARAKELYLARWYLLTAQDEILASARQIEVESRAALVAAARKLIAEEDAAPGEPRTPPSVDEIVDAVAAYFRTFGGGRVGDEGNPVSVALKDGPPVFAAGVDVRGVVEAVVSAVLRPGVEP